LIVLVADGRRDRARRRHRRRRLPAEAVEEHAAKISALDITFNAL
jgi:hypothetical protein